MKDKIKNILILIYTITLIVLLVIFEMKWWNTNAIVVLIKGFSDWVILLMYMLIPFIFGYIDFKTKQNNRHDDIDDKEN